MAAIAALFFVKLSSAESLLGEETSTDFARAAIDKRTRCNHSSYVHSIRRETKDAYVFDFIHKGQGGSSKSCPSLNIVVDRKTGEVWIKTVGVG